MDKDEMLKHFGNIKLKAAISHSYCIAPSEHTSILINKDGTIVEAKWGISPVTHAEVLIHRIDYLKAHVKPSFRIPFRKQRCILLADSYYAWTERNPVPVRVQREDQSLMFIPSIYQLSVKGEYNFTLISRPARSSLSIYSNNEPILMSDEQAMDWLDDIEVNRVIKILHTVLPVKVSCDLVSTKILVKGYNEKNLHNPMDVTPTLF